MRITDSVMISNDCFDTAVVFSVKINLDRMFKSKTEFESWDEIRKRKEN